MNRSAHIVQADFSLARAYALFTSMGVRHLIVVDAGNCTRGIVTRKDLLQEKLNSARIYTESANGAAALHAE